MAGNEIAELDFQNGKQFIVVIGDLLDEPVDCIVNAANGGLSHGGGVAAAIAAAAGARLEEECENIIQTQGRIPVTNSAVTTAGNLPFKGVIHAVGPSMGEGNEGRKLKRTLMLAFLQAHQRAWTSLAFPGVSSGIFAVPHEICAQAYLQAVTEFFDLYPETTLRTIRLCLFEGSLLEAVKAELKTHHSQAQAV